MNTPVNFRAMDEMERRYDGPMPVNVDELRVARGRRLMHADMMRLAANEVRQVRREGGNQNAIARTLNNWRYYRSCRRHWHLCVLELLAAARPVSQRLAAE